MKSKEKFFTILPFIFLPLAILASGLVNDLFIRFNPENALQRWGFVLVFIVWSVMLFVFDFKKVTKFLIYNLLSLAFYAWFMAINFNVSQSNLGFFEFQLLIFLIITFFNSGLSYRIFWILVFLSLNIVKQAIVPIDETHFYLHLLMLILISIFNLLLQGNYAFVNKKHMSHNNLLSEALGLNGNIIVIVDQNKIIKDIRPETHAFLSVGKEELVGKPFYLIFKHRLQEVFPAIENRSLSDHRIYTRELYIPDATGRKRWLHFSIKPILSGKAPLYIVSVEDISQRKIIELALSKNLNFFQNVINTITSPVIIVNQENKVVLFNPAFHKLLGLRSSSINGKTLNLLFSSEDFIKFVPADLNNCEISQGEWLYRVNNVFDNTKNFIVNRKIIQSKANINENILYLLTDVTSIVNTEERLKAEIIKQKESLMKAKQLQFFINSTRLPVHPGLEVSGFFVPSEYVGGDLLKVFSNRLDKYLIALADCNGHGVEASMYATLLNSKLENNMREAMQDESTSNYLKKINFDMVRYVLEHQFPTISCGMINSDKNQFTYSNANGHQCIIIRDGVILDTQNVKGFFIGFHEDTKFEEAKVDLLKGDQIIFFSDAILEENGLPWDLYNKNKFYNKLLEYSDIPELLVRRLREYLNQFAVNGKFSDDLSFLHVIYHGNKKPVKMQHLKESLGEQ